jgi:membrane-associated phospholipid phosphatase
MSHPTGRPEEASRPNGVEAPASGRGALGTVLGARRGRANARRPHATGRLAILSLLATAAAAGLYMATVGTRAGQLMSELMLGGRPASPEAAAAAARVLSLLSWSTLGLGLLVIVAVALAQGRPRLALTAGTAVVAANITSQLLKETVLDRSDLLDRLFYPLGNSFPSGHATAAASIAVGLLLVLPPLLRSPTVLIAALGVALVGTSTLVLGWHRMADAIGGVFVATAWGAGLAALLAWRRNVEVVGKRSAAFGRLSSKLPIVIGGGAVLIGVLGYMLAIADPLQVLLYLAERGGSPALFSIGVLVTVGASLLALGGLGYALRDLRLDPPLGPPSGTTRGHEAPHPEAA